MMTALKRRAMVNEKADIHVERRRHKNWSRYSNRTFYLFLSPWLFGFFGLTVIPVIYALCISFTDFDGISHFHWIGAQNYVELFHDQEAWYSLGRTALYTVVTVPLTLAGALVLALLLNRPWRSIGIFRTLFYLPAVMPVVSAAIVIKLLFDRDTGIINSVALHFGWPALNWLNDPYAFLTLIVMVIWGMGGGMIIFLAGLQGIPVELTEAAQVDGASAWMRFRSIIIPLLTPVIFFQLVTGIIYSLQTLIQPLLLVESNGAVTAFASEVPRGNFLYMVDVFAQYFTNQRFGYGAAMLWVLFIVVMAITLLVFRTSRLWLYYEVEGN